MRFKVQQYEIHVVTYYVDADDRVDAVDKVVNGGGKCCLDGREFLELAENFGLDSLGDDFTDEESAELNEKRLVGKNDQVLSIHSVEESQI